MDFKICEKYFQEYYSPFTQKGFFQKSQLYFYT